jgi:hypothetical protein
MVFVISGVNNLGQKSSAARVNEVQKNSVFALRHLLGGLRAFLDPELVFPEVFFKTVLAANFNFREIFKFNFFNKIARICLQVKTRVVQHLFRGFFVK